MKNVLGADVTIYKAYAAPNGGINSGNTGKDWPSPLDGSVDWNGNSTAGNWNWKAPPATAQTTFAWDHDCDDALGPPCAAGEHPGIWYEQGWDNPSDDIGIDAFGDAYIIEANIGKIVAAADPFGEVVDWSWTLNYGHGKAPGNDIIYGLDPGPPLDLYDLTVEGGTGNSIPGITGTPKPLSTSLTTVGGGTITGQAQPGVGGTNQPTWQTILPADIVGQTSNQINWGLMTFQNFATGTPDQWCANNSNYKLYVPIVSDDSGDVTAIHDYMQLKYYTRNGRQGLSAAGGTPTKEAITRAGQSISDSWDVDPKKRCPRPWGIILCTDGLSNTCNTGTNPGAEWTAAGGNTPCENDTTGTDYPNYPPGAAEAVYNLKLQDGGGAAVIRPRTFAIGIAPEVGRCELNRVAYRGRSDANAVAGDAGFLLYDPTQSPQPVPPGDKDLGWVDPSTDDESGPGAPPSPNHFRFDQTPPVPTDYAFFALDTDSIAKAFKSIVDATARGDYSTSAPVSGAGVAAGDIVLLPSAQYPKWWGHLRALDTTKLPTDVGYLRWDAADVLNAPTQSWQPTPATRAMYTWDPSDGHLISIDVGNVAELQALSGDPGFTVKVIDFMRGYDGSLTNTQRPWILGPAINSTPAVVGKPLAYRQFGTVADHKPFETQYSTRRPLAWLGSDDGFVHAFDFADGTEVLALLPPNLLSQQVKLYQNYLNPKIVHTDTGQSTDLRKHVWGVSNSFRYQDVYFASGYKTVGIITEGPAGDLVAAIDITHPFAGYPTATPAVPADPNYDSAKPIEVLWTKNSTDFAGLYGSWSVPALAADGYTTSRLLFGAGVNPSSVYTAQKDAAMFVVDPLDGTLNQTLTATATGTPSPLVGQQTFADGVLYQTSAPAYQPDNVANLGVQVDTNGRAWFTYGNFGAGSATSKVGIDLNTVGGGPQPLYYSPAVTGIGRTGCQVYALASGSLYETSPTVSGWNVNRPGAPPAPYPNTLPVFTPYLYIGVNPTKITDVNFASAPLAAAQFLKKRVGGEVPEAIDLPTSDPAYNPPTRTKLGPRTQVTGSPFLAVDQTGTGEEDALFLLYDPDNGCFGQSYIVQVTFTIPAGCAKPTIVTIQTSGAGAGAASGLAATSTGAFVAQSGQGTAQAGLFKTDIRPNLSSGAPTFFPVWWRDVK